MPSSVPIKIAILNDYELVVAGIRRMLEPHAGRVKVVETVVGSADVVPTTARAASARSIAPFA